MLTKLPKEMYAEIARFLGSDFPGDGFRKAAETVQIKDVINNCTYLNGTLHSFNGLPAIVRADSTRAWYLNGVLHRDNKPAIIKADGTLIWYQLGKLHRDGDLPALIWADGTHYWYQHGKLHRDNGPAIVCSNGDQYWHL